MQFKSSSEMRRALLGLVLERHPAFTDVGHLRQEFGEDADQAVDDLVAVGLLVRELRYVGATHAAVQFDALRLP